MLFQFRVYTLILVFFLVSKSTTGTKFSIGHNGECTADYSGRRIRKRSAAVAIFDQDQNTMKWNKKNITYRITEYTEQISKSYVDTEIAKAFELWSEHADLEFIKSSDENVDIEIRFCTGEHGDRTPFRDFDIAHAFAPDEEYGGDVHFNDRFTQWQDGTTLLHTATHEIGHAIGLNHIPLKFAVMSPYQGHAAFPVHLAAEDIEAAQALYGKKPQQKPPVPPQTTTNRPIKYETTTTVLTTLEPELPPQTTQLNISFMDEPSSSTVISINVTPIPSSTTTESTTVQETTEKELSVINTTEFEQTFNMTTEPTTEHETTTQLSAHMTTTESETTSCTTTESTTEHDRTETELSLDMTTTEVDNFQEEDYDSVEGSGESFDGLISDEKPEIKYSFKEEAITTTFDETTKVTAEIYFEEENVPSISDLDYKSNVSSSTSVLPLRPMLTFVSLCLYISYKAYVNHS